MIFEKFITLFTVIASNFIRFLFLVMIVFDWIQQIRYVRYNILEYSKWFYYKGCILMTIIGLCGYRFFTLLHYDSIQMWNSLIMNQVD